jgi:plastocyanin
MRGITIGLALAASLVLAACSSSPGSTGGATAAPAASAAPTTSSTGSAGGAGGEPGSSTQQVKIAGFAFAPLSITVKAGTTVTWVNQDTMPHTVTADDGSFDSGSLAQGATFSQTFTKAGTYPYHCTFHSSMHGTVTVTP